MGDKPTIAISHLGCEKNRIDTEHMLGLLVEAGYGVDSNEELADYVIVNTCSFIEAAREESVRTLVELAEANKKVVITGCMAQHFQEQLLEELPEAVAVVGTGDYHKIVNVIERVEQGERVKQISSEPTYIADETTPRYRTTTEGVAYLRVAEGCDYRCAFCIIPHLRGNQRSRTIESIVAEAEQLAAQGVQEIILISQITTNYGLDIYGKPKLAELIRALGKVDIPWVRMHYAYPTGLSPDVIAAIQETSNFLPYLDLPLQHSHPEILRAMNRPWQGRVNDGIIERIKTALPSAVLRTTLIVGFPGETEEHFQHLLEFTERHEFDHVGVFTFSPEEGTPAYNLPNQLPQELMVERRDQIMALQQPISLRKNQEEVGKIVDVLIEQENPGSGELIGRSARFSPEVDGQVYVTGEARLGTIVPVKITSADAYDLYGEVVNGDR
ncbi:MAG: 30S ribosomal protein S12 methylthiotransferase RimO [Sphaerospermopsis sp.]|jgi:ribosomal protein S12 methylthiotransferase|uniref:Ribosomal protein uS12 methylthiotransferase RimO n=1 Tax=Sphaerospermopsis aphanizomenoides LEGE 00250 TaxID=2777972 RepID=A0ABR9VIU2_9CYAN|nr:MULTISPECIES: 30S ribosomal protein S12 methylthiotransferase RimO [Sphaerospermopsis]MEB3148375.1 30S ribosomal protein S12 methylthiotransferase RimO [Sphaerospermopsis sp.]MBC5793591.1 30S ribosomal protein S12 methylthiotransferase RimO [Sphaerospermopsis sp. LEGE 00249]MBD2131581.1 30S ribosomal protein S12 methylthiotransferase RimO [Sphaerospermopsis sp. FACHB-1094]MBD2146182.1 30S ribosomal protein S12 methylthiotransferase RimO [Sphaerospermopsis sp. FACHB-1194]MBE9238416.1 30S rib